MKSQIGIRLLRRVERLATVAKNTSYIRRIQHPLDIVGNYVGDIAVKRAFAIARIYDIHKRDIIVEQPLLLLLYPVGNFFAHYLGYRTPKSVARVHIIKSLLTGFYRRH